jgi:uncharacterized protein (TIGR03435 family)
MAPKIKGVHIVTKVLLPAGLLIWAAFTSPAQEAAPEPQFEVASVKPAEPLNTSAMMSGGRVQMRMGCFSPDPGRFECSGMPLRPLLAKAYGVKMYQFSGPGWMDSERFDIVAKVPAGATPEQVNLMLQKLLVDRFQIAVHRENKEMPVFALVVGRNGHKLKAPAEGGKESPIDAAFDGRDVPPPPPAGGGGQQSMMVMRSGGSGGKGSMIVTMRNGLNELLASKATMSRLADFLSTQVNRPVVDETGLTGEFDFTLDFARDETVRPGGAYGGFAITVPGPGGPPPPPAAPGADNSDPSAASSIFTAIQNQLGLKLEAKKGSVETIMVDKAEKVPSAN